MAIHLILFAPMHLQASKFSLLCLMFRRNKFDVVDIQNATLSGGVAVGALADLMIQPYGAFVAGSLCGVVSTLGYKLLQVRKISIPCITALRAIDFY